MIPNLEEIVGNGMLITGGHFMINKDSSPELNKGTVDSFRIAAELYKNAKEKGRDVGFGILINDIGATCDSQNGCNANKRNFSRENYSLPQEYLKILSDLKIGKEEVSIYWEKHMRNRGHKLLRKEVRKGNEDIEVLNGDHWLADEKGYGRILLSRAREHDQYGNAACPLIMAAFAMEQERKGFKNSLNIYYTGSDNLTNVPNHHVIEKGQRVAEIFGTSIDLKNVYFSKDRTVTNFGCGEK
jgi:hypothetical protein